MQPIDRLIAATDLSAPARHAAERAALVAQELGASLDLLHVISVSPVGRLRRLLREAPADLEDALLGGARAELERLAGHLGSVHGVAATAIVRTGDLLREIERHAEDNAAGLLAFGARGASFMRHALLGSTAERMVRKSAHPLLVVKQPPRERYRRVLVGVDFSPASLPALTLARALAPSAGLVILNAYAVPFEDRLRSAGVTDALLDQYRSIARRQALHDMHGLLESAGLGSGTATALVLEGEASSRLLEQEQELDCDLVVVGRQGESRLEEALLGSVTKHVLQDSQGDVLVSVGAALQATGAG